MDVRRIVAHERAATNEAIVICICRGRRKANLDPSYRLQVQRLFHRLWCTRYNLQL